MSRAKHLMMTNSGKGGVGKTTTARLLAETLRVRCPGALLVDGNGSVGQMLQYLGTRKSGKLVSPQPEPDGVRVFDLHGDERDRDELLALLESGAETILVDLPAESLHMLSRLDAELSFFELVRQNGYALTLISPVTPYRASVRDIQTALALVPAARHIIVRNLAFGDPENPTKSDPGDFGIWNESKTRQQAIAMGAVIIDLPRCKAGILAALDDESISFAAGTRSPKLSIADRQRLHVWLRGANAALEPVVESLGLAAADEVPA